MKLTVDIVKKYVRYVVVGFFQLYRKILSVIWLFLSRCKVMTDLTEE